MASRRKSPTITYGMTISAVRDGFRWRLLKSASTDGRFRVTGKGEVYPGVGDAMRAGTAALIAMLGRSSPTPLLDVPTAHTGIAQALVFEKPKRGICAACSKKGVTIWHEEAGVMRRWCQYCGAEEGQREYDRLLRQGTLPWP